MVNPCSSGRNVGKPWDTAGYRPGPTDVTCCIPLVHCVIPCKLSQSVQSGVETLSNPAGTVQDGQLLTCCKTLWTSGSLAIIPNRQKQYLKHWHHGRLYTCWTLCNVGTVWDILAKVEDSKAGAHWLEDGYPRWTGGTPLRYRSVRSYWSIIGPISQCFR